MKNKYKHELLSIFVACIGSIGILILVGMSTVATIVWNEPFIILSMPLVFLFQALLKIIMFIDEKEEAHQNAVKFYDKWIRS